MAAQRLQSWLHPQVVSMVTVVHQLHVFAVAATVSQTSLLPKDVTPAAGCVCCHCMQTTFTHPTDDQDTAGVPSSCVVYMATTDGVLRMCHLASFKQEPLAKDPEPLPAALPAELAAALEAAGRLEGVDEVGGTLYPVEQHLLYNTTQLRLHCSCSTTCALSNHTHCIGQHRADGTTGALCILACLKSTVPSASPVSRVRAVHWATETLCSAFQESEASVCSPSPQHPSFMQHAGRAHSSSAAGSSSGATAQQQQQQALQQPLPAAPTPTDQQAAAAAAVALPSDDFEDEELEDGEALVSPAAKPDGGWGSSEEGVDEDDATSTPLGEALGYAWTCKCCCFLALVPSCSSQGHWLSGCAR